MIGHLARRWVGSLSWSAPPEEDLGWVAGVLTSAEARLWGRQRPEDLRHTVSVARRFARLRPDASRDELAGALLHDVGKTRAGLGSTARVAATVIDRVVGLERLPALGRLPGGAALRCYLEHERVGGAMLRELGVAEATCELVEGRGPAVAALRAADDV